MPRIVGPDESNSLKSRHIQFIALGGTIGTGLFLGVGEALAQGGPLSIFLGYSLTGLAVFGMVRGLIVLECSHRLTGADAIVGRNGHLAPASGRDSAVLCSLRGPGDGLRRGLECE